MRHGSPQTITIKCLSFIFLLGALFGAQARGQVTAASCNTSDVQTAINKATEGQTVNIPAGTCTWTSGVSISGKGIAVTGAGSGRVIAYSTTQLSSIGTGTQTWSVTSANVATGALSITNGETLTVYELGTAGNFMTGTVTSYSGGSLIMTITSTGGTCGDNSLSNCRRWIITTPPSTVIVNNTSGGDGTGAFQITEDTSFNTNVSGIQIAYGKGAGGDAIDINYVPSGVPVLIHDMWIRTGTGSGDGIHSSTNRGVVWNLSADASPFASATTIIHHPADPVTNSWTTASTWGAADTTGTNAWYVETSDFHAYLNTFDNDNNGRLVFRYNLMNNASATTHGSDSSTYGQRYFEYYNNMNIWNSANSGDSTSFNLGHGWILVRGGSFVAFNNNWTVISGYYNGSDVEMGEFALQYPYAQNGCWGSGWTTKATEYYHAPRQVGYGYVTGTGTANYPPDGVNNASKDATTYVGDSEPAYIWNNTPGNTTGYDDGGGGCSASPLANSAQYIVSGQDFIVGTAKPGYTPYTYPHPLTQGGAVVPPTGLQAVVLN